MSGNLQSENEKKSNAATDLHELIALVGCFLIMSFNHLPSINNYWSSHCSLGNPLMKKAFSGDRFKILMSKLYLNEPEKPSTAKTTYYVEQLVSCLKSTFQKYRKNSTYQSIDESMTKFKDVRSSSYLPLKPVKRGIKVWRCDAYPGYTYDMNVYAGREEK